MCVYSRPHSVSFLGKESLSHASVLALFLATVRQLPAVLPLCLFTSTLQGSNFHPTYKTRILSWSLCWKSWPKPRVKLEWQKVSSNLKLLGRPDQINPLIASCKGRISILRQRRSLHGRHCQHVTGNRCHLIKWRLCQLKYWIQKQRLAQDCDSLSPM